MDEDKYIRGLSDYELSRMVNLDSDRYTRQELETAVDEINRREQAKAPAVSAAQAKPAATPEPTLMPVPAAVPLPIATPEPMAPPAPAAAGDPAEEPPAAFEQDWEDGKANALSPVDARRIRRLTYSGLSDIVYIHADQYTKAERDIAFNELCLREEAVDTSIDDELEEDTEETGAEPDDTDEFGTDADDMDDDGLHTLDEEKSWTGHGPFRCPYCARELPGDAKFCLDCGRKVAGGSDARDGGRAGFIAVAVVVILFLLALKTCM